VRIGVPAEVKQDEYRVALTPSGAYELVRDGHEVWVETGAGVGAGCPDSDYERVGANIGDTGAAWLGELIVKVKEPQPSEFGFLHDDQILSRICTSPPTPASPMRCAARAPRRWRTRPSRTASGACRCSRR